MKITSVLDKYIEDGDGSYICTVREVPQKYVDMAYEMNEECGGYFDGGGLEITFAITNGKLDLECEVQLQYYWDDYFVVAILNDDKEVIKMINKFLKGIAKKLPNNADLLLGQTEYEELTNELLREEV